MDNRQRILIVDDERINRKVLTDLLQDDHRIIVAKNGAQALKRVESDPHIDLILLDVMMPDMDGYEVLEQLKRSDKTKDIMVVFITALTSLDDEERGLRMGATDYIGKPFRPSIVKARVENYLQIVRQRKLLENLAGTDGLTEICNRRRFDELLELEWRRCERNGLPLSLVMVDVDYFKSFNDHYGHAHGDQVLKSIAKMLSWNLHRPADLAARYGGEEFVLLFPDTDTEGAISQAERIREAIEALSIPHNHSAAAGYVSISMGGATHHGELTSTQSLLEAADAALYKAKSQGRNCTVWANSLSVSINK
jgi:diguanylate cyclase (GGDEF)-like protein